MGNQENIDSNALNSAGSSMFPRYKDTELPCKVRKTTEHAEIRFLPAEEFMKLKSCTKTAAQTTSGDPARNANPKCHSQSENAISSATSPQQLAVQMSTKLNYEEFPPGFSSNQFIPDRLTSMIAISSSTSPQQLPVQMSTKLNDEDIPPGFSSKQFIPDRLTSMIGANNRSGKLISPNAKPSSCLVLPRKNIRSHNSRFSSSLHDEKSDDAADGVSKQGLKLGLDREKDIGSLHGKELIHRRDPVAAILPDKEDKTSSNMIKQLSNNSVSLLPMKRLLSDGSPNNPVIQENGSQIINTNFPKYPSNGPALEVIWKGSFKVLDMDMDHDTPTYIKLCEGFVAHPPAKVSCKAYEFSKQIAGVLHFKLHPRCHFWPEIFQTDLPDLNDIALYFYPGNFDRSRKKYSILLQHMEKNDLVLRHGLGSVELLVFPSKLLPADSQKLKGCFFLWGVFRHLKGKQITFKANQFQGSKRI